MRKMGIHHFVYMSEGWIPSYETRKVVNPWNTVHDVVPAYHVYSDDGLRSASDVGDGEIDA